MNIRNIFSRKKVNSQVVPLAEPMVSEEQVNLVYRELQEGLTRMQREGIDFLVLRTEELDRNQRVGEEDIEFLHVPAPQALDSVERDLIEKGKSYQRIGLVAGDLGGLVKSNIQPCVEFMYRNRFNGRFLCKFRDDVRAYTTSRKILRGEEIKDYAKNLVSAGCTPEQVRDVISGNIVEYREITGKLMEKGGVYDSIAKLEKRISVNSLG